jgi:signal peptidase II
LYWTRVENTGVAFGMMQGKNDILSYILPVVLVGLPIYIFFHRKEGGIFLLLMGCVYGGALGNYYDRLHFGYVRDFIDVRFGDYYYPVFNIADAFISCSVVLMFFLSLLHSHKNKPQNQSPTE